MRAVTVDTWILMHGTGKGHEEDREEPCARLMETLDEVEEGGIVLDEDGFIEHEYREKLGLGSYGMKWVGRRMKLDEVEWVPRESLPDDARTRLDDEGFNGADRRFVSAAHLSTHQVLAAEESDYSDSVRDILRRQLSVSVVAAEDATRFVRSDIERQ